MHTIGEVEKRYRQQLQAFEQIYSFETIIKALKEGVLLFEFLKQISLKEEAEHEILASLWQACEQMEPLLKEDQSKNALFLPYLNLLKTTVMGALENWHQKWDKHLLDSVEAKLLIFDKRAKENESIDLGPWRVFYEKEIISNTGIRMNCQIL